jgi:3-dehydroquinate synthase
MLTIKSRSHDYNVENYTDLGDALGSISHRGKVLYLVDEVLLKIQPETFAPMIDGGLIISIQATEEQKSLERLAPLFLQLLDRGIKRNDLLVVIGGGVLQDIGCFISSVLFRGIQWELIPTTLLAQADSCIGSKSSINIGSYKNQIGTFYPPHRVLLVPDILSSLAWDEIRSGLGEVIKLQLLKGKDDFEELMGDLHAISPQGGSDMIAKWVMRSMLVKKPYIESDEYDVGIRNLLNYGHTFGHAYESATHYAIPHGIAVTLGMLTSTFLSMRLGLVEAAHYQDLKERLFEWHIPYGEMLRSADRQIILRAIRHDKKNTGDSVNCILTRGCGRMEKIAVDFNQDLIPMIDKFIDCELEGKGIRKAEIQSSIS